MQPRQIFINIQDRSIGTSLSVGSSPFTAFEEDVEPLELYFYETKDGQTIYRDYSSDTVKLAVGVTAPAAFQNAWTAISSAVTATITTLQAGGGGNNESQRLSLSRTPDTGSFTIQFPARTITVSSITASTCLASAHGLFNGQSIALTGFSTPTGFSNGDSFFVRDRTSDSFRVTNTPIGTPRSIGAASSGIAQLAAINTPPIAAGATPKQVESAIAASGLVLSGQPQVAVVGTSQEYTLNYSGALANIDMPQIAIANNTLAGAAGLSANLSFNTAEVAALVAAGQGANCRLEVEVTSDGIRQTIQAPATIQNDIITSTSPSPLPAITPACSFNLIAPNSDVWNVTIDNDGVLTAAKQ
jgi:hypothetical protein